METSGESDPLLGRTIARKYVIESVIGQGAMGCVYTARHLTLDTVVAVKVLHGNLATDAAFAERFHREAKSASRLHHRNVIQVIDFGREDDGLFYIAMEYAGGADLFQVIQREWPLNQRRIGEIACQILSGIAAAHDIGIVHRDLKPENVIVTRALDDEGRDHDVVKVCDFGIAKIEEPDRIPEPLEGDRALTTRGMLLGTPQYMSPEQCRGDALDARSDIYSIGVVLYQLLAGRLPFVAPTTVDVVIKQVTEEPIPPTRVYPGASVGLEAVCLRALRKLPEQRYSSAREMSADIRQALQSPSIVSIREGPVPSAVGRAPFPSPPPHAFSAPTLGQSVPTADGASPPGRARFRRVWTYAAAASILAAGVAVLFFHRKSTATQPPPASHSVVSVSPPKVAPEGEPNVPEPPRPEERSPLAPDRGQNAEKKTNALHRVARSTLSREADEVPNEESTRGAPASPVESQISKPEPAATAVPTAPARPPTPPPPVTSLDPEKGLVTWKVSAVGGGATAGGVARALSRAAGAWTRCYRSGLRARGKSVEGSGHLRLTCDDQGRVVQTTVSGFAMPDVTACIRESAAGVTIPNADTGEAWASILLTFDVRD